LALIRHRKLLARHGGLLHLFELTRSRSAVRLALPKLVQKCRRLPMSGATRAINSPETRPGLLSPPRTDGDGPEHDNHHHDCQVRGPKNPRRSAFQSLGLI
jgi:hypothetical protein